jgi:hypothetical protein
MTECPRCGCANCGGCYCHEDNTADAIRVSVAAERDRIRQLALAMHDRYADHAKQASALPLSAQRLSGHACALSDFADLLAGDS